MAQSTAAETKSTEAKPAAKAKAKAEEPKSYTLYHTDGRKKVTTDVGTVVNLEFNGWSQTEPKTDEDK